MIKHIIKLIWNQRKSNSWLLGELLLVSVCLWYVVDYFLVLLGGFSMPLGFDIDHVYQFQFSAREEGAEGYLSPEEHPATAGEDVWAAVERLRRHPAVEEVAVSQFGVPYTEINNYVPLARDTASHFLPCRYYRASPEYFKVYRIPWAEGKQEDVESRFSGNYIIVSRDAAEWIFDGEAALNREVWTNEGQSLPLAAVTEEARPDEFCRVTPRVYLSYTEADVKEEEAQGLPWVEVSVRVKPEADRNFVEEFMRRDAGQMEVGNVYLQNIQPVSTVREDALRENKSEMNTRLSILFFLLMNIFLGIVGTFWFRTRHRQGEMGLRMALGSTRPQLRRVVVGEGLLLLVFAFVPALIIAANITYLDLTNTQVMDNSLWRFLSGIVLTFALMALMIVAGIWYPASEAARIEPAESLHYE